ncbi:MULTISPECIES: hypothetical protein [unclassified Pseudonocardia]|uniref:hypothetical protein n=1 Tax=unclassified Pseudonocardia TaxID=2619320 RepID=UPI00158CD6A9
MRTRGAEHELGGVDPAGEVQQRPGHGAGLAVADDGVEGGTDVVGEGADAVDGADRTGGEAVAAQGRSRRCW